MASQGLNGDIICIVIRDTCRKDASKRIYKYILYLCCLYIHLKIACEIIAIMYVYFFFIMLGESNRD